jgi:pyrroloquinoline quinone biosynthesis protein B
MKNRLGLLAVLFLTYSILAGQIPPSDNSGPGARQGIELVILGTLQDGGSPHMGCAKQCCTTLFNTPDPMRKVVSLGILDALDKKTYLFEATPDIATQMSLLKESASFETQTTPDGIFITHAHIGHYAGLMFLGRESMNAEAVPVYALPRMRQFLSSNGPWDQLVRLQNIVLKPISEDAGIALSSGIKVVPFTVPHRDEYSETAGFEISGPEKQVLFIPDIDKWDRWEVSLAERLTEVDFAFLDATFFDAAEIGYRDIKEIPHPFVIETMKLLEALPAGLKNKVYFIHLNHTNPLLDPKSDAAQKVLAAGFRIARVGDRFKL